MNYGVVFPQTEIGNDPIAIRDFAQAAEGLGFDYLLAFDHVLGANPERPGGFSGPYTYRDGFHEPFVLFGYLAALTTTLELVTGVVILPQRQTALVAKQAAAVDVLSGGRMRLGVGIGWNRIEYEALGEEFRTRGKRMEEQVAVLRHLWQEPLVTFHGEEHTISDAGLNPLPVRGTIPLWFGGSADPVLQRMARLGDGWMPAGREPDADTKEMVDRLHGYLEAAGRQPLEFGIDAWVNTAGQSPDDWRAKAEAWTGLGATHLGLYTMRAGFTKLQEHIDAIRRFKEAMD